MTSTTGIKELKAAFTQDKETDNNYRFAGKPVDGSFAGSLYIPKALMPSGTTKAVVTVVFE